MRVALIAASIFLLLLMFVLLPWAAVLGAIAVRPVSSSCRRSRTDAAGGSQPAASP